VQRLRKRDDFAVHSHVHAASMTRLDPEFRRRNRLERIGGRAVLPKQPADPFFGQLPSGITPMRVGVPLTAAATALTVPSI
jgi:hypothetical protein